MSSRACAYAGSAGSGTTWNASTAREKRCPVKRYFAVSTSTTRCPAAAKARARCSALVIFPPLTSTVRRCAGGSSGRGDGLRSSAGTVSARLIGSAAVSSARAPTVRAAVADGARLVVGHGADEATGGAA